MGDAKIVNEEVKVQVVVEEDARLPSYETEGAAGADVRAHLSSSHTLMPQQRVLIPTGIRMHIPEGYEVQVRPRSGLAYRHGITLVNSPGTIDADYRGELKLLLINHGDEPFEITPGMRIGQIVLSKVYRAHFDVVQELGESLRGTMGFGHTGHH